MNFFSILAAVGMLALAGLCGYAFALLEEKAVLEQKRKEHVTSGKIKKYREYQE